LVILFMGIASPLFTSRMEVSTNNILLQMQRPQSASRPAAVPGTVAEAAVKEGRVQQ